MYSYYGLDDRVVDLIAECEQEIRRPIWVLPSLPSAGVASMINSDHLSRERENLDMENLTAAQLTELVVAISFDPQIPNTSVERELEGRGFYWSKPREAQPFQVYVNPADEESGLPLCYVKPDKVFCLFDYLPYLEGLDEEMLAMWACLLDAVRLAGSDDVATEFENRRRAMVRETVAAAVRERHETALVTRRRNIEADEERARAGEASLREIRDRLRTSQTELDLLIKMRDEDTGERMLTEFDMVAAHPRVTDLDYTADNWLTITTDEITMTHPLTSETRLLGRFKIKINNTLVRLTNLDRPRSGRDHPHVTNGEPCFGGHDHEVEQLLVSGRWFVFLEFMFQYLETFNPRDDWGRYAARWFDAPDADEETVPDASRGPIIGGVVDMHGHVICEGDRVSFMIRDRHVTGTATATTESTLPLAVHRDDNVNGGGPGGSWLMSTDEYSDLEVTATPAVATS